MIAVKVDDEALQRSLSVLARRITNTAPAMREIGSLIADHVREGFKAQRSPWGESWRGLAIATRFARARKKAGGKVYTKGRKRTTASFTRSYIGPMQALLDTGRLRNSITAARPIANGVEVGTSTRYAAIQQFGGQAGRSRKVTIPARPFMPIRNGVADLPPAWKAEVLDIVRRRIVEAMK